MKNSEFEHAHHLESKILEHVASEGLVIARVDKPWGPKPDATVERHLVAVVAGEDGPRLVMASAWDPWGDQVQTRIHLDVGVDHACRRFLPESGEDGAAKPHPGDKYDEALASVVEGEYRILERDANIHSAHYVVRIDPGNGGEKSIAVACVVRDGNEYGAEILTRATFGEFREWVASEFGSSAPRP